MIVQVNTDHNISGSQDLSSHVEDVVSDSLSHFGERITRVEVHLSDENSHKSSSDDKKCVLEARMAGMQPIAVTHQGETIEHALHGAADKLKKVLESAIGKLNSTR